VPPLSHLTSCTPTKSNLYLAENLETDEMLINIAYGHKIMRTVYDTMIMHVTEEDMLIRLTVIR
jgi:hypothetical protein